MDEEEFIGRTVIGTLDSELFCQAVFWVVIGIFEYQRIILFIELIENHNMQAIALIMADRRD